MLTMMGQTSTLQFSEPIDETFSQWSAQCCWLRRSFLWRL